MKIIGTNAEKCTFCGACETTCSTFYFKEDNRQKSAIRVEKNQSASAAAIYSCNQCGNCVEVCPVLAIKRTKSGVVVINKKLCAGCFNCVGTCSTGTMFWHEDLAEPFKCIACLRCTKECPTEAIFMQET